MKVLKEISRISETKKLISDESTFRAMVDNLLPYHEVDVTERLGRHFAEKYNTYIKIFKDHGNF